MRPACAACALMGRYGIPVWTGADGRARARVSTGVGGARERARVQGCEYYVYALCARRLRRGARTRSGRRARGVSRRSQVSVPGPWVPTLAGAAAAGPLCAFGRVVWRCPLGLGLGTRSPTARPGCMRRLARRNRRAALAGGGISRARWGNAVDAEGRRWARAGRNRSTSGPGPQHTVWWTCAEGAARGFGKVMRRVASLNGASNVSSGASRYGGASRVCSRGRCRCRGRLTRGIR